jgi:hypothetical protein
VPIAALRKLGNDDVHLVLAGEPADGLFEERWLEDLAAGATALIAQEAVAARDVALRRIGQRVAAALGLTGERRSAAERHSLDAFAPLVGQIDDLEVWSPRTGRRSSSCDPPRRTDRARVRCARAAGHAAARARRAAVAGAARRRADSRAGKTEGPSGGAFAVRRRGEGYFAVRMRFAVS